MKNSYFNKYLKYKHKYLELKMQIGGSKKISTDIFTEIKSLEKSNINRFMKKFLLQKEILNNIINDEDNVYPLQLYINLDGTDKKMIDYLFPSDEKILQNIDKNGNTIFHTLIKKNNIDLIEYIYFKDENIAQKILEALDKSNRSLRDLAFRLFSDDRIITNAINMFYDFENYGNNKMMYLRRVSYEPLIKPKKSSDLSAEVDTVVIKKEGKRKIFTDILKNNEELNKLISGTPIKRNGRKIVFYFHPMSKNILNRYITNEQIKTIDTLYLVKSKTNTEEEQIRELIPNSWIVNNIRFVDNFGFDSKEIDYIVQLEYDYTEQESDDESNQEGDTKKTQEGDNERKQTIEDYYF